MLVFVEFASERSWGTAGTVTRDRTQTEWLWSNEHLAHVVRCLSSRYVTPKNS